MLKKLSPVVFLLLTFSAFAQTVTSYPVTGGSGTATTPTRVSFSTAELPSLFFESGYNTSCGGQTTQALGFVLLNGGIFGSQGVCASVTTQPVGSCGNLYAEFNGKDAAGIPFTGTLSLNTTCQYVRMRYSKTVYTVRGGMLTITE